MENADDENNNNNNNLQSMMMILRTARIANLQCAATTAATAAATNSTCMNSSADEKVMDIENLILHVQQQIDKDVNFHDLLLKNILPTITTVMNSNANKQSNNSVQVLLPKKEDDNNDVLCTSIELDAFFDDYPQFKTK